MELPKDLQPTETIDILLPNGGTATLPVCRPAFSLWTGVPVSFDYGSKPVLTYKNKPYFAELVILQLLLEDGWNGVWVETYGGTHCLRTMPTKWRLGSKHVSLPADKEKFLKNVRKTAKTSACFDVFAWRGEQILFCEAKRVGKDKLTKAQIRFIEGALKCGVASESLLIVEWASISAK